MRWRRLELTCFGALLGALVGAGIARWLVVRLDGAYQLPILILTLAISTLLGMLFAGVGPIQTVNWLASASRRAARWVRAGCSRIIKAVRAGIRRDPKRSITALLHVLLALVVSGVLIGMTEVYVVGVPLAMLFYLTIAFGLWHRRDWVIWLARWTHCFVLAVTVNLAILAILKMIMLSRPSDFVMGATLLLMGAISVWTLVFVQSHSRKRPSEQMDTAHEVGMFRCALRTAAIAILASIPLALPVGMLLRVPYGPYVLMLGVVFFGLVYGGILIPAALGGVAGCLVYRSVAQQPEKLNRRSFWAGVLCALPGLVFLAIMAHIE